MNLTLVRHCEVEEKYIGCYNGHIDIGLSKNGYTQAKELAKKLDDKRFDVIFCSDLIRAKESLKYFKNLTNIIYTDRLREKSWGEDEGKTYDEICRDKNISYKSFEQWLNELDGESVEDFKVRIKEFFFKELKYSGYKNVLIMTHSGVIKTFFSLYNDTKLEDEFSKKLDYSEYKRVEF